MAVAGPSGDFAGFNADDSDSGSDFEGFDAGEIERSVRRQSDDDFDIDADGLMSSGSDLDSDADDDDVSVHGSSGDGSSDAGSGDDDVPPPVRRPRARAVPVGRQARPRAQAQPARAQPQARQCQRTNDLVNQAGLPYTRAADVGVTDRQHASQLSPFKLFTLFFTDYLLRDIVCETNRYAEQCMAQPPKRGEQHLPWSALTVPECRTWLGLLMSMGVVQKIGRLPDYWSRHAATYTPFFSNTMPCRRFLQILRYLHFIDNESDNTDKTLRTWKVQRVLDYLVKRFRDAYTPRRELSVDETMLKFKGRLNIKQYIKIKPVKWGIKLFTLAESITGYVLDLLPYTGRRADTIYSKTTQTVLDVSRHYLHLGHHIFFDNYYMSVELIRVLFEKKSLCCGTVNANRVGLPGDMKK